MKFPLEKEKGETVSAGSSHGKCLRSGRASPIMSTRGEEDPVGMNEAALLVCIRN